MGFLITVEKRDKVALSLRMEKTFYHTFSVRDDDPVVKEVARVLGLDCRSNDWQKRLGEGTGMRFLVEEFFSVIDKVGAVELTRILGRFRNASWASIHIKVKREYDTVRKLIARGESIEGEPIIDALVEFTKTQKNWNGTATELLKKLSVYATPKVRKSSKWPRAGVALSSRLTMFEAQLREQGVLFEKRRTPAARIIELSWMKGGHHGQI